MKGVNFLRRTAAKAAGRLANALPKRHDPVFGQFTPAAIRPDGGTHYDYFGVRTALRYRHGMQPTPATQTAGALPPVNDQYPEWVFLLESVLAAKGRGSFVLGDFGAGWGPWLATGHAAWKQLRPDGPTKVFGVEADKSHFGFLKEHLAANGIGIEDADLVEAAVFTSEGFVEFEVADDPQGPYGQSIQTGDTGAPKPKRTVKIRSITAESILSAHEAVDYLTIDIQGAEKDVVAASLGVLTSKVRRLQVATHSPEIHQAVHRTLSAGGWVNRFCFPFQKIAKTPWGWIKFEDGSQSWINPRLECE
jgi:FkbM family methyltransferase